MNPGNPQTFNGTNPLMDQLTYNYEQGTNKLTHVDDAASHASITADMDDQPAGNYSYDASGKKLFFY